MPGPSRRAPYPADLVLAGIPFMLGSEKPGEPTFVGAKPQDLASVVPTDFGPSALNPILERTQIYDDLSLGMGQRLQSANRTRGYRYLIGADQRYYYALGVDASTARQVCMGPSIGTVTPATRDSVNGITAFWEIGGNLFALNGRYPLYRQDDATWPTSGDFTAGKVAQDVVVFASNATGVTLAYVAMGDTEKIWKFDGSTPTSQWTQSAENLFSRAWAVVGREFWRATPSTVNTVSKVDTDADPFVLANWSNANTFTIGDQRTAIQRLAVSASGGLLILKTDGIYTLDSSGFDHNLYPFLRGATDTDNGKFFAQWLNDVYVAYRDGTFRIDPAYVISEIGPEKLTDNSSPVKGRCTAMQGHDTFNLYAGLYNDDTTNSYLMKFGGWDSPQDAPAVRVDAWHGSISAVFTGKKITAMYRASTGNHGAPAGHSRMYLGFSDGTIAWFVLPCTPNPVACSSYLFSTADGELDLPDATMGFVSDSKAVKAYEIGGPTLSATSYLQVQYRTDPASLYTTLVDKTGATVNFANAPLQRQDVPAGTFAQLLTTRVVFKNGATSTTPVMNFVGVHYVDRTLLWETYEAIALTADGLARRDGTASRRAGKTDRDALKSLAGAPVAVTAVLPDETSLNVFVVGYEETMGWYDRSKKFHSAVKLTLADASNYQGTLGTLQNLSKYTLAQLGQMTLNQMNVAV